MSGSGVAPELRAAWQWHCRQGGGIVGESARCALELARAELTLAAAEWEGVARFGWVDDDEPYSHGVLSGEEVRGLFESGAWTGPFGAVLEVGPAAGCSCGSGDGARFHVAGCRLGSGEVDEVAGTSLWGIVLGPEGLPSSMQAGDPYARTVRAELAAELIDELRQAIGDARDWREGVGV